MWRAWFGDMQKGKLHACISYKNDHQQVNIRASKNSELQHWFDQSLRFLRALFHRLHFLFSLNCHQNLYELRNPIHVLVHWPFPKAI